MADRLVKAANTAALVPIIQIPLTALLCIGCFALFTVRLHWFFLVIVLGMLWMSREIAKENGHQFRIFGLFIKRRILSFNWNRVFWKSSNYTCRISRR